MTEQLVTNEEFFKITKASGYILHCSLISGNHDKLIVMCHGGLGDKYEHNRFSYAAKKFEKMGYDTLLFDFTGAGQNVRIPITIEKMKEDLKAIWEWATKKYDKLCTIGLSLGGLISLITDLPRRNCAIFWAPAFNMKNAVGRLIILIAQLRFLISKKPIKLKPATGGPALQISNELIQSFKTMDVSEELTKFALPTLIVQGTLDMTVKPKNTVAAFGLMPEDDKHLLKFVKGAPHDFRGKFVDEFIKYTLIFLNENL